MYSDSSRTRRRISRSASGSAADRPRPKRGETEIEVEVETDVGTKDDWRSTLAVEDEQLVDWSASEETAISSDSEHQSRKR